MKADSIRFWEIDFLRGLAVVMMIAFHFFFDLNFFGIASLNLNNGLWIIFARLIAIIFIFLVGVSLTISYAKAKIKKQARFRKYLFRGIKIFGYGLIISIVTFLFLREGFIMFGILHFIGISIILAYPFVKLSQKFSQKKKVLNYFAVFNFVVLFFGIAIIIVGLILNSFRFDFFYLMWLGFIPTKLYTFDYFPLLPWFGIILIGIFAGNILYKNGKRSFSIPEIEKLRKLKILKQISLILSYICFLGRHSLIIYLLHQPILSLIILTFKAF